MLLSEILAAIDLLRQYTAGVSFEEFAKDIEKQDAVVRRLEVIGEAVKGIPSEIRSANPDVPWREIAGARDVLIHEYFRVDLKMAWDVKTFRRSRRRSGASSTTPNAPASRDSERRGPLDRPARPPRSSSLGRYPAC